jgi:hypothetical protein
MGNKGSKKDSDAEYLKYLRDTKKKHRLSSLEEPSYPEATQHKAAQSFTMTHSIIRLGLNIP